MAWAIVCEGERIMGMTSIIATVTLVIMGGCLCSLLGIVALGILFPRKDSPLKNKLSSCDDSYRDSLYDPKGNYDWSHIPDDPNITEDDLFEKEV